MFIFKRTFHLILYQFVHDALSLSSLSSTSQHSLLNASPDAICSQCQVAPLLATRYLGDSEVERATVRYIFSFPFLGRCLRERFVPDEQKGIHCTFRQLLQKAITERIENIDSYRNSHRNISPRAVDALGALRESCLKVQLPLTRPEHVGPRTYVTIWCVSPFTYRPYISLYSNNIHGGFVPLGNTHRL